MLDEIGGRTVSDLLREVARAREPLHVVFEDGNAIDIEPSSAPEAAVGENVPKLKPLTVLEGFLPEGWKDAIYDYTDSEF
jgi:hypothetical protein